MTHLPTHRTVVDPRTGKPLRAIGHTTRGPIWPVMGGDGTGENDSADEGEDDAGTDRTDDDKPEGDDDKPLGPAGEKALAAEKEKRKAAADRARKAEAERDQLKTELAKLQKGGKSDDQPDPEEIRKQAKAEAAAEMLRDRALDKVEAKAARMFADPEDARALLSGRVDEFVDDGKVDTDAIEEALADLLKKKPHLAAQGGKRFEGSADGGARNGKTKPSQLTRDDLKRMSPQAIRKAQDEGRLADLLSGKQ